MKFVVEEMPKQPEACVFAERKYNPPVIEEPYYCICKLQKNDGRCKLSTDANGYKRCPCLVDIQTIDSAFMQE